MLSKVQQAGGEFGLLDGQPFVRGHAGTLTPDEVSFLRSSRGELARLLAPAASDNAANEANDREALKDGSDANAASYPYAWSGQLLGHEIGIDCETTVVEDHSVPTLVLVSVSDGSSDFILRPDQLPAFLEQHESAEFIAHNAAFDFWVIAEALTEPEPWWGIADAGRLHDTMFLDALIRLARTDDFPRSRDLGTVAREYASIELDKADPYRTRFGELIGVDWSRIDRGFFDYAIADARATILSYHRMKAVVESLKSCSTRFGLLTETLQVRAAIALDGITRNGMCLDPASLAASRSQYRSEIDSLTRRLLVRPIAAELFKRNRDGSLRFTKKSQKPQTSKKHLEAILDQIAAANGLSPPRTAKTGTTSTSVKWWAQHQSCDPFLADWVALEKTSKLFQFFSGLTHSRIHPRYQTLVRTGRTSCSGPNIQQLPRDGGFREMVIASPGTMLLIADYSAIELRTLASVCEKQYGASKLADVLRAGIDPHAYTAAMFAGVSLEEFEQLQKINRKQLRQRAKALNFGIPGGLGVKALVEYANQTYGVELSIEDAQHFRDSLTQDVYPELSHYLHEDSRDILARNLCINPDVLREYLCESLTGASRRIVRGETGRRGGQPYSRGFMNRIWITLQTLNRNPNLDRALVNRQAGEELHRKLFWSRVETPTGRIRGRVSFSQARNTPFQGLAADGAKLALWRLLQSGYRMTAFVHDEVVIELPEAGNYADEARRIEHILCESMTDVLQSDIPITVEFAVAERWYKQAEAVWEDGRLVPWEPAAKERM